jgi:hypothetical protein
VFKTSSNKKKKKIKIIIIYGGDSQEGIFLFGLDRGIHGLPGGTGTLTAKNKIIIKLIYISQ